MGKQNGTDILGNRAMLQRDEKGFSEIHLVMNEKTCDVDYAIKGNLITGISTLGYLVSRVCDATNLTPADICQYIQTYAEDEHKYCKAHELKKKERNKK